MRYRLRILSFFSDILYHLRFGILGPLDFAMNNNKEMSEGTRVVLVINYNSVYLMILKTLFMFTR